MRSNIMSHRWTPLFCAVYAGPLQNIDYLIWKNANVNKVDVKGYEQPVAVLFDSSLCSSSFLHRMSYRCEAVVICETLIAYGSEIEVADGGGLTPLMLGVFRETIDVVRVLLALKPTQRRRTMMVGMYRTRAIPRSCNSCRSIQRKR